MNGPASQLFFGSLVLLLAVGTFAALTMTGEQLLRAVRHLCVPSSRQDEPAGWPRAFARLRSPDGFSAEPLRPRLEAVCGRAAALRDIERGPGGVLSERVLPLGPASYLPTPEGTSPGEPLEPRSRRLRALPRPPEAPGAALLPPPDAPGPLRASYGGTAREPGGGPLPAVLRGWRL